MTPFFSLAVFAAGAVVIAVVGSRMTRIADRLADRTGWGEAVVGATLLGGATSLPGITASVTAAIDGQAQLALSNAIGGIAAQTAFLAIADLCYRRANLEHAAASVANMLQATVLTFLLAMLVVTLTTPPLQFFGVHPVSALLPVIYFAGMKMVSDAKHAPMWQPRQTDQTETDTPDEEATGAGEDWKLWGSFVVSALVVVVAGYAVTRAVQSMIGRYEWLGESMGGAVLTAVATSLPELVTSIAAVRRGALTLAVGGLLGGNCFDTLFAAVADFAYRDGSIYHAAMDAGGTQPPELMLLAASIVMTSLILAGLLVRQPRGPGRIGFESIGVLLIYAGSLYLTSMGR